MTVDTSTTAITSTGATSVATAETITVDTSTTTITSTSATSVAPSPTSQSSQSPSNSSYISDSQFEIDILSAHNFYREQHNVSDLIWNETSAKLALDWSRHCIFNQSLTGPPPTQNLLSGENRAEGFSNPTVAVDSWGLERLNYSFQNPGYNQETNDFTQLVWSDTTSVGCGRTNCPNVADSNATIAKGWYVVCEYFPPGNTMNMAEKDGGSFFQDNVKKQVKGNATDSAESAALSGALSALESAVGAVVSAAVSAGSNIANGSSIAKSTSSSSASVSGLTSSSSRATTGTGAGTAQR
ncbi:hypothetical protein NHQ30_010633 [Ciborinia camelliae]|nr:hypothetical protein NHQ30_010633 [Ciborinia camelliae]